ncbi:MAG: DUF4416 family protein [bacterium]
MEKRSFQITESRLKEFCKKRLSIPEPVKLFMGLILSQDTDLEMIKQELTSHFGRIDLQSPINPFDHTDYYIKEMGHGLQRCFLSFEDPASPDQLAEIKLLTNRLEIMKGEITGDGICRKVNIDPGILSLSNVILATTKNRAHRIYLSNGIYAEVTLIYSKNKGWQPLDWTYPDYRISGTIKFFHSIREKYYLQIRDHHGTHGSRNLDKITVQD